VRTPRRFRLSQGPGAEADWRDAINLRHRIAHGYDDLSFSILWSIVVVELDPLAMAVERIVASEI